MFTIILTTLFIVSDIPSEYITIRQIGLMESTENFIDLIVDGRIAYIAAGKSGIFIVSLEELSRPRILSKIESMDFASSIDLQGHYLFIADGKSGVRIFNVRNREYPEQMGFIPTLYTSLDIETYGKTAYVAEGKGGIRILDIERYEFPEEIFRYRKNTGEVRTICISGGYSFAGTLKGILIFNLEDEDSLPEPTFINTIDSINSIVCDGRILYASGGKRDFIVSSINNIENPVVRKLYGNYSGVNDMFMSGYNIFLSRDNFGISILNYMNPFDPVQLDRLLNVGNVSSIYACGNIIYITTNFGDLKVFRIEYD